MTIRDEIAKHAAANNTHPPSRLGRRYDASGFLPEAGNTVVCHLDFTDPAHRAILDARERMQSLPGADRFLFTPVDSLHMTLFEGAIETRRTTDAWPAGLDQAAPIDSVTETLAARLAGFPRLPGFNVRAADLRPTGLILEGATDADKSSMLRWRDTLTEPFGYRHAEHDTYRFHMTFAYPLDWIPDHHLPVWEDAFRSILEDLTQATPTIPLTPPAFCRFADMTRFEELVILQPAG